MREEQYGWITFKASSHSWSPAYAGTWRRFAEMYHSGSWQCFPPSLLTHMHNQTEECCWGGFCQQLKKSAIQITDVTLYEPVSRLCLSLAGFPVISASSLLTSSISHISTQNSRHPFKYSNNLCFFALCLQLVTKYASNHAWNSHDWTNYSCSEANWFFRSPLLCNADSPSKHIQQAHQNIFCLAFGHSKPPLPCRIKLRPPCPSQLSHSLCQGPSYGICTFLEAVLLPRFCSPY